MTAAILTIVIAVVGGVPIALSIDRRSASSAIAGEAPLLGLALLSADLAFLTLFRVAWSPASLAIAYAITLVPFVTAASRRREPVIPRPRDGSYAIAISALAIVAVMVCGYAIFATVAPTIENDFLAIWGVKAKQFLFRGAIDFRFLENPWNAFAHTDYPILVPLLFDVVGILRRSFEDRWIGLLYPIFGAATLLFVFRSFREDLQRIDAAAVATLAVVSSTLSPWIGLAEGPLIAYGSIGLLLVRRGLNEGGRSSIAAGAVFLGLAASCKNEGLALIVAVAISLVLLGRTQRRAVAALWPAALIVAPWLVARAVHDLPTDLAAGSLSTRIVQHLANFGELASTLLRYSAGRPLFWGGVVLAIAVFAAEAWRRERFLLVTIVVQFLFFIGAYIATPHDIGWHVRWSWERIVMQLALPAAYLAIVLCARPFFIHEEVE